MKRSTRAGGSLVVGLTTVRLPGWFAMFFGPFLVPLTTMFGEPMGPFPPDATSEAISKASQVALQSLMTRFSGEGGSGGGGKR